METEIEFNNIIDNTFHSDNNLENQEKEIKNQTLILNNREIEQSIELRYKYSSKIFWFIIWWSVALFLILILQGSDYENINWNDNIIITLIGTTFIQVLGLMIIVLHYIFPVIKK